jgi:hypothetical protein
VTKVGLHIGLPKTGTTTLQALCFARHPQVRYFGQTNVWSDPEANMVLKGLIVEKEANDTAGRVRKVIGAALKTRGALVISDEAISFGEFMLRATQWPITSDHRAAAERAHRLLGDAHVLIVLRNQADWLQSWHKQGLKTGKYAEIGFSRWLEQDLGQAAERLLALLRFDELYRIYADVFGQDRVHIRLYEQYQDRFEELAAEFATILRIDPDVARSLVGGKARNVTGTHFSGLPPFLHRALRHGPLRRLKVLLPPALKRSTRGLFVIGRAYGGLREPERRAILERFATSNRALFCNLGISGDGLGYF